MKVYSRDSHYLNYQHLYSKHSRILITENASPVAISLPTTIRAEAVESLTNPPLGSERMVYVLAS